MLLLRRSILSARFYSWVIVNMNKESIVPDVIDISPEELAQVTYRTGVSVNLGNILTPTQVKDIPTVTWKANEQSFYTLCMTDPDAPCRLKPTFREWHHWLVGNIPGTDVPKGETLSHYIGSAPPEGTGLHRYVFLIYRQSGKVCFKSVPRLSKRSPENRGGFSIRRFAADFKLGMPIAANFYQAEYDDHVYWINRQLGICCDP